MFVIYATTCCTTSEWEYRGSLAPYVIIKITGLKDSESSFRFLAACTFSPLPIIFVVLRDFPILVLIFQVFTFYLHRTKLLWSFPSSNKTSDSKTWDICNSFRHYCHTFLSVRSQIFCCYHEFEHLHKLSKIDLFLWELYQSLYIVFWGRRRFYCSSVYYICSNILIIVLF